MASPVESNVNRAKLIQSNDSNFSVNSDAEIVRACIETVNEDSDALLDRVRAIKERSEQRAAARREALAPDPDPEFIAPAPADPSGTVVSMQRPATRQLQQTDSPPSRETHSRSPTDLPDLVIPDAPYTQLHAIAPVRGCNRKVRALAFIVVCVVVAFFATEAIARDEKWAFGAAGGALVVSSLISCWWWRRTSG